MKKIILLICVILITVLSFGQDSLKTKKNIHGYKKILVVEEKKGDSRGKVSHRIFNIGDNVVCETSSTQKPLRGAIKALTDTSVVINKKTVLLNDIKSFKRQKGEVLFIVVGAALAVSGTVYFLSSDSYVINMLWVIPVAIGGISFIGGLISMSTIPKYVMDKGWKIYVITKERK